MVIVIVCIGLSNFRTIDIEPELQLRLGLG